MYFPVGWPKLVDLSFVGQQQRDKLEIRQICCDRVKLLVALIADNFLGIWFTKPFVPIVYHRRLDKSVETYGSNKLIIWKPDSTMIAIATSMGNIILYSVEVIETTAANHGVFNQIDSPMFNLRRDSPELFIKDTIPALTIKPTGCVSLYVPITSLACISMSKIMVSTTTGKVFRLGWDGSENTDLIIDLKKSLLGNRNQYNQQQLQQQQHQQQQQNQYNSLLTNAEAVNEINFYINSMEYSPLIGGFAVTLKNGRAGFLSSLADFNSEPKGLQIIWAPGLEDATCCSINHKFRLLAFGRENAYCSVYTFEETSGGLELSHSLCLNVDNFSSNPGPVNDMKWTPDGCALIMSWRNGGFSLWSTFGTLLTCSLEWDYGVNTDLTKFNPLTFLSMDWSVEGCQLIMLCKARRSHGADDQISNLNTEMNSYGSPLVEMFQMDFVKSTMTSNPCMSSNFHILLQGDDKLYINQGRNLEKIFYSSQFLSTDSGLSSNCSNSSKISSTDSGNENLEVGKTINFANMLSESKHWIVVQMPLAYAATNWPIRYTAIDAEGMNVAVAGRTGLAHYSILTGRWKLFGNETQEKDFVVTGGLLWWQDFIVMGCFSLIDHMNEIRIYPREAKLDNQFLNKFQVKAPIMLLNVFENLLVVLLADGKISTFRLTEINTLTSEVNFISEIDIRNLCIHPAYVVSLTMANINNEMPRKQQSCTTSSSLSLRGGLGQHSMQRQQQSETLILNVSGRILMIQPEIDCNAIAPYMCTCLASSVECIWLSASKKSHMRNSIWLYSGSYGMRLWLPVLCDDNVQRTYRHTFMSKRIMLSFPLKVYPLVILFEDVIILGVENDTGLYTNDANQHFSLPYCTLDKKNQIYLHKILRQLIRRNLGYTAWEIAKSCSNLPYFPHSLELLLHEVLEDEATSKDPIPDAMLPSVLEFIREFPVYLQTIVQCARKTEIALWPYLFATAGKPKELFQQCLSLNEFETAASYLVILQNLEPSAVSRQYATLLLDTALDNKKWELARDLVRFLKAIDPEDVESPRSSLIVNTKFAPCQPHSNVVAPPNPEDINLILGAIGRGRSFSTTITPQTSNVTSTLSSDMKDKNMNSMGGTSGDNNPKVPKKKISLNTPKDKSTSPENFFIELILQRHARKLLEAKNLRDLGYMSASLDFHLVGWLIQEKDRAARIENFVDALNQLHMNLQWPQPTVEMTMRKFDIDSLSGDYFVRLSDINPLEEVIDLNVKNHGPESGYSSLQTMENNLIYEKIRRGFPYNNKNLISINENDSTMNDQEDLNNIQQFREDSVYSDEVSMLNEEDLKLMKAENVESTEREINRKLEVQIRYLLQLFIEANCLDYSLLLSIILLDAVSVIRIGNAVMRSVVLGTGTLNECRQILKGLKDIAEWSSQEGYGYSIFMMRLRPQIDALSQFIIQKEYIKNSSNHNYNNNNIDINTSNNSSSSNINTQQLKNLSVSTNCNTNGGGNNKILNSTGETCPSIMKLKRTNSNGYDVKNLDNIDKLINLQNADNKEQWKAANNNSGNPLTSSSSAIKFSTMKTQTQLDKQRKISLTELNNKITSESDDDIVNEEENSNGICRIM